MTFALVPSPLLLSRPCTRGTLYRRCVELPQPACDAWRMKIWSYQSTDLYFLSLGVVAEVHYFVYNAHFELL
jgi:hypothetical protein